MQRIIDHYLRMNIPQSIASKIMWYLADEKDTIVSATNVYELDINAAIVSIMKIDSAFSSKYRDFLEKVESIQDKKERNILLGKMVSSKDIAYLNYLCKITILTYVDKVFDYYHLLELKKDGVLVVGNPIELSEEHPLEPRLRVKCTIYETYVRAYKTSYMCSDSLTVKGNYKGLPIKLAEEVYRLMKGDLNNTYYVTKKYLSDDLDAQWLIFENGKVMDEFGNLVLGKPYPLAYLMYIYNPVWKSMTEGFNVV